MKKYKYKVTFPMLPPKPKSPVMNDRDMEWWLHDMQDQGWEFVAHGQKNWVNGDIQDWWVFRKELPESAKEGKRRKN